MKDFTLMLKGFPCETGNEALRTDRTDHCGFTALQLAFSGGASSLGLRSQDDRVEALEVLLIPFSTNPNTVRLCTSQHLSIPFEYQRTSVSV